MATTHKRSTSCFVTTIPPWIRSSHARSSSHAAVTPHQPSSSVYTASSFLVGFRHFQTITITPTTTTTTQQPLPYTIKMIRWPGKEPEWGNPWLPEDKYALYKPMPGHPGETPPGDAPDNFPVPEFMQVPAGMVYQELDMDARCDEIYDLDEDFLEFLGSIGRLIPRNASEEDFDNESEKLMSGITEEDLEFGDDPSDTLAYYAQREPGSYSAQDPYSMDYGNLTEYDMGGGDGGDDMGMGGDDF